MGRRHVREAPVEALFSPSSVVVIGVSTRRWNLGKEIARNLLEFEFNGIVELVGAEDGVVFGRPIYRSVEDIPHPVDLAIILTPARTIAGIMDQCGRKGIRRVIIESGGFGEFSDQGKSLGQEIKATAARYGIRFIGPNCIGLMNSANGLATPFMPLKNAFKKGGVGIIAQSGGVALTMLNLFDGEQLGFSKFAAIGNKLDIDENDVLEHYVNDNQTSVACLYLESIQDGRRLMEIGRQSSKPIVVHKANIGSMSRVIAHSHTEALANDDQIVDAALRQAGMARFADTAFYLDFVKILQLPRMKGRNLAIVSRSGGHAVMAADAAYTYGFNLPPFKEDFLREIRRHLRADVIRLTNPLDLGDLFDFEVYVKILKHTLEEENVDGILFLHTYSASAGVEGETSHRLLASVAELSKNRAKPIAVSLSTEQEELSRVHRLFDFPVFMSPERAVHALDQSIQFHERKERMVINSRTAAPTIPVNESKIGELLTDAAGENRSPLLHEAFEIAASAGLTVPPYTLIQSLDEIEALVSNIPRPYAVKVVSETLSHKSDSGGVRLNIDAGASLRETCRQMFETFSESDPGGFKGLLVQQMADLAAPVYEIIIGGKRDPHFGPVVLIGHGGIFVEIFGKTSIRVAPVNPGEAEEMIEEMPGSEILKGVRGRPPVDTDALKHALLCVSQLMCGFSDIDQIDINPVLVSSTGALAVDARIVRAESPQ
jgi:acetyltransferase